MSESVSCSVVSSYLWPIDCGSPGSSVHGISQARILEWVAISFSRGSSWPRDQTWVSHIAGRFFTIWATREAPIKLASYEINYYSILLPTCYTDICQHGGSVFSTFDSTEQTDWNRKLRSCKVKKEGKSPRREYKIWNKPVGKSGKALENVCPPKKRTKYDCTKKKIKTWREISHILPTYYLSGNICQNTNTWSISCFKSMHSYELNFISKIIFMIFFFKLTANLNLFSLFILKFLSLFKMDSN